MRNGRYGRDPRLTKEQDAMRLQGLRVLARMIARAHLKSLVERDAPRDGCGSAEPLGNADLAGGQAPLREDKHAG